AKSTSRNTKLNSSSSTRAKDGTSSRSLSKKELARQLAQEENSSPVTMILLIIAASFAAVAYLQDEIVEKAIGFNLKKMIHGEPERAISSVPSPKKDRSVTRYSAPEAPVSGGKIIMGGVDISMEVYVNGVKTEYIGRPFPVE